MRILFVDVDGVCNTDSSRREHGIDYIHKQSILLIKEIVIKTNCKIVISSTWRLIPKSKKILEEHFDVAGILKDIIGETPNLYKRHRGVEISRWLKDKNISKYAIVDDTWEAGLQHGSNLFLTHDEIGLTDEITKKIIEHLNG